MCMQWFPDVIPWYVLGPGFGLVVTAHYALTNRPLGSTGAYAQLSDGLLRRPVKEIWRLWYMLGICLGAAAAAWLRGEPLHGLSYGALGRALPTAALVPLLLLGGVLMGYGSRTAGGCTSGHGLCGNAARSPASFATTVTFFATAVAVTLALRALTGGVL